MRFEGQTMSARATIISVLIVSLVGCSTSSTFVPEMRSADENIVFYFSPTENDPLNLRSWVADEIQSQGFSVHVQAFTPQSTAKPNRPAEYVSGSGFLIAPSGFALTNAHVVNGRENIAVRATDGSTYSATVVGLDNANDVAVLRINATEDFSRWLQLGSTTDLDLGMDVFVIGYPLAEIMGIAPKVTKGIISALSGLADDPTMLQISAPIQPGNSGGPILNAKLMVVGIATEKLSDSYVAKTTGSLPQNVNFGVKIDYAKLLLSSVQYSPRHTQDVVLSDLSTAAEATVLILASSADTDLNAKTKLIEANEIEIAETPIVVTYEYSHYYDVFHNTLTYLKIEFINPFDGSIVASGNFFWRNTVLGANADPTTHQESIDGHRFASLAALQGNSSSMSAFTNSGRSNHLNY